MFCHKCGNKIIDGATFCSMCGTKIILEENSMLHTQEKLEEKNAEISQEVLQEQKSQPNSSDETNQQNTDCYNANVGNLGIFSAIGSIVARIAAIALPLLGAVTLLSTYPVLRIIVLVAIVIFIIFSFRHDLKKMMFGLGTVFVILSVIAVFSAIFSGDNYVKIVKEGTLDQYPQKTIGKAFDDYLENEVWESGTTEDGTNFVNVKGDILYTGRDAEVIVQFLVDTDNDRITYNACEIDNIPQNNFVVLALFNAIYSDAPNAQSGSNAENRIMIGETQSYQNQYGNMKVTLDYIEITDRIANSVLVGYEYPDDGSVFLNVAITAENIGTEKASLLTSWNTLVYDGIYEYSSYATQGDFIEMAPLTEPKTGTITFMIPKDVAESEGSLVFNINDGSGKAVASYVIRMNESSYRDEDAFQELQYKGMAFVKMLGESSEVLEKQLGQPDYGTSIDGSLYNGGEFWGYDGIMFVENYQTGSIGWITGAAEDITVDGVTLDKTRTDLIDLLGMPDHEESVYDDMEDENYYIMEWHQGGVLVSMQMADETGKAMTFTISLV